MSYSTSGDKLMRLRKQYGIKQYELAGDNISRSYIGMVEQNRRKITRAKAEEVTKNFNKLLKKRNIIIKLEDFFVEVDEEMSSKAEKLIKFIRTEEYSEAYINELRVKEREIVQNNRQNRAEIYFEVAKKAFVAEDHVFSVLYFVKSFEYYLSAKQYKELSEIIEKLSVCYNKLNRNNELENLYYCVEPFFDKIKQESKNVFLFNSAKTFYKLGKYRQTIKVLDNVKNTERNRQKKSEILNLMAKAYVKLERYSEAEFCYEKIQEMSNGIGFVEATLNILELNKVNNPPKRELKKIYSKISGILNEENKEPQSLNANIFLEASKLALKIGDASEAEKNFNKALNQSNELKVLFELLELKAENSSELLIPLTDIEGKLIEIIERNSDVKAVAYMSSYYLANDMLEENNEFIKKFFK